MLTMEELGYFVYMNEIEKQQSTNQNETDEADDEEQTTEDISEQ